MVNKMVVKMLMIFFIINLPEGDYVTAYIAQLQATGSMVDAEEAVNLRIFYGLDKPLYIQFFIYTKGVFQGNFGKSIHTQHLVYDDNKVISNKYRSWIRFSNDHLDLRIGLQKITFGTALFLRPLAWFDSLDFRFTTGQTDGVEALRLILSPSNSLAIWLWSIDNNISNKSYGGRIEIANEIGDWGFTYYQDSGDSFLFSENNRLGIDYRYDGNFGFWIEGCHYIMKEKLTFLTLGFDYTIPAFNGILLRSETMFSRSSFQSELFSVLSTNIQTAFHLDIPIDHINSLSLYSFSDWEEYTSDNLIRWSTTYDSFNIDYMLTLNPGRFNDTFQIMFIYNH